MTTTTPEGRRAYQREYQREYMKRWARERRAEFFAGKSCVQCGSTERLELDHVDPSQKTSHRIWTWSKARRDEETAKCQILCHDCHQIKSSAEQAARVKCGTEWSYRKGCRCEECRTEVSAIRKRRRQSLAA